MRKKKIFIVSKLYDTAVLTDNEIKLEVQKDLDTLIGAGRVKFDITSTEKGSTLIFHRNVDYGMTKPNTEIIDADAYMICGIGLDGFKLPQMWYEPPFGYSYHFKQSEFKKYYKKNALVLGADKVGWMKLDIEKNVLKVRIR